MWDQTKIHDWLALHPNYMTSARNQGAFSGSLLKKPSEPTVAVDEAVKLIEAVLPNHIVQRSWSLGPQRMCQELRRVIVQLRSLQESHNLTGSS
jgi:hypothetical protein